MTRTGTMAIGGSAKIAMLMPRASRSLTGDADEEDRGGDRDRVADDEAEEGRLHRRRDMRAGSRPGRPRGAPGFRSAPAARRKRPGRAVPRSPRGRQ